jgi:LmbE family N-acetylglucosaminyl deacetylase
MLNEDNSQKKVVIFAAHADDEVLGCGATAAKYVMKGHEVTPVIICENASVRYGNEMKDTLEGYCRSSSAILGLSNPIFINLPDQKLDAYTALEMAQILAKVISDLEPDIIFTHHGGDINKDHRVVFEATLVAARPLPDSKVHTIYCYETISSTEWGVTEYYSRFTPNTFYDVTETLELKLKAFSQYKSEVRDYPHPRSLTGIEIRAKDWGTRVGLKAAEAFQLVRHKIA